MKKEWTEPVISVLGAKQTEQWYLGGGNDGYSATTHLNIPGGTSVPIVTIGGSHNTGITVEDGHDIDYNNAYDHYWP